MSKAEVIINKIVIIVLSAVMFFSGLGLIVAGGRTKKKIWTICGLAYICLGWILMSVGLVSLYLILFLVSIVHTVVISKEYCMRLQVLKEAKDTLKQKEQEKVEKQQADLYAEIVGEENIDKKEKNNTEEKGISQVDINKSTESELSSIPGIGLILAKRIIDVRKEKPFLSLEDFYKRLSIEKDKEKLMAQYLICTEINVEDSTVKVEIKDTSSHTSGRKIDI